MQKREGNKEMKANFEWLQHPSVIIIIGGRGSGKTATAFSILDMFHERGIETHILGHPKLKQLQKEDKIPEFHHLIGRQIPAGAILIDDAQLTAHAREWHRNIALDKLVTVSRHKNASLIYTTQQTVHLDRNIVAEVDCIIFKQPSLMAPHTERPFIQKMMQVVEKQYSAFIEKHPDEDIRAYSYCLSNKPRYEGFVGPTKLPAYWSEELSTW
jgi:predicted ATPase